jgi:hypothetical protein
MVNLLLAMKKGSDQGDHSIYMQNPSGLRRFQATDF